MDTKRLLLAIVLSFVVLFGYQLLFNKKVPEPGIVTPDTAQTVAAPGAVAAQNPPAGAPGEKSAAAKTATASLPVTPPAAAAAEIKTKVDTSLFEAVWTNKGGVLLSWKLKKHLDEKKQPLEMVPRLTETLGVHPLSLLEDAGGAVPTIDLPAVQADPLNASFYEVLGTDLIIKDGQKGELRFRYSDGKDIEVEKIYTFTGGKYDFQADIKVLRGGKPVEPRVLWGPGIGNPTAKELQKSFGVGGGMTALAGKNFYRVDERKFKPERSVLNFLDWAAYDDNYFCALILPAAKPGAAALIRKDTDTGALFFLAASRPGRIFIGPKDYDLLTDFGHNAKKLLRFGTFGIFAEILFATIKVIHRAFPNWGWSIIILTLIIKIIFFPLTYASTKSMSKMAALQPKIKALRNKYKKSKTDIQERRRMNEEMMALYKQHGVNPAGGCLPLLIQIPFFFGIFSMLRSAIEFRQSPWILWIGDLSVRDPYYVTPVLMGITQFISQKMTPTSADPSQAKMMMIMPFVMTIFFMNFQSGLVLYWLTSNVLQIAQQALINRMMKRKKGESNGKSNKK
ncbi:MAG: membrane protein insertase YidC [Candidatus Aminicenantes bacterium]|nr:membrane protein insertase YidC [Candidatus Aminicenantes bacterium]